MSPAENEVHFLLSNHNLLNGIYSVPEEMSCKDKYLGGCKTIDVMCKAILIRLSLCPELAVYYPEKP